jgi:hypothetical protein
MLSLPCINDCGVYPKLHGFQPPPRFQSQS